MNRYLITFFIFIASFNVKADCINAEGSEVTFNGVISKETYAGPPNYESIAGGDVAETYWFVTIPSSLCVVGKDRGVLKFQLFFEPGSGPQLEEGAKYSVSGVTFMGISGHHHTPVLIEVSSLVRS